MSFSKEGGDGSKAKNALVAVGRVVDTGNVVQFDPRPDDDSITNVDAKTRSIGD